MRAAARGHNPRDILLPQGYIADVVATGFNTPVRCTFDDRGSCYVVECGHKVEATPRILKVDLQDRPVRDALRVAAGAVDQDRRRNGRLLAPGLPLWPSSTTWRR